MTLKKRKPSSAKSGGFIPLLAIPGAVAAGLAAANSGYDLTKKIINDVKNKKGGAMVFSKRGEGLKKRKKRTSTH